MPSSTMRTAVLQATAFGVVSLLYDHHFSSSMFDAITENETYKIMAGQFNATAAFLNSTNATIPATLSLNSTNQPVNTTYPLQHPDITLPNGGPMNFTTGIDSPPESFYGRRFPREVFLLLVYHIMRYYWFIWLEKLLPARPRYKGTLEHSRSSSSSSSKREEEKVIVDVGEDREEEIVKRWLAQGRVRRASLNWCNTLLKWILEWTVGRLGIFVVEHVIREFLQFRFSPKKIRKNLLIHISFNYMFAFIHIQPLLTLIAFIIVPAHRQVVFLAGARLVTQIFYHVVMKTLAGWVIETEFAQDFMRDITDNQQNVADYQRYRDEKEL